MSSTTPPDDRRPGAPPTASSGASGQPASGQPAGQPASGGDDKPPPIPLTSPSSPHIWTTSTYFAEGFPYTIVNSLADVMFKEAGASLQAIGLTTLFHLPWNLKFLWGPFLDNYATKRAWLVWIEVLITALLVVMAFVSSFGTVLAAASVCFVLLAVLSATHDIAIDGYYLEGLDKDGQSQFVGYRVTAYRLAMLSVSGPLLVLIGRAGWTIGFLACAAIMGLLLLYHATFLPRAESPKRPFVQLVRAALRLRTLALGLALAGVVLLVRAAVKTDVVQQAVESVKAAAPVVAKIGVAEWIAIGLLLMLLAALAALPTIKRRIQNNDSAYAAAFIDFLSQPKVGLILTFIILFRAGESYLLKMRYPFMKDIGMTLEQYGLASGTLGIVASFTGTLIGGHLISKKGGIQRWIWPFTLAQNGLHLLFMGLAWYHDHLVSIGAGPVNLPLMTTVITIEAFGAGFGTAVFMVYIMRCCRPAYKAAHMAILTALMSLSFTLAGVSSGFLADWMGYTAYFGFTFVVTIPSMLLLFYIPYLDGTTAADAAPAQAPKA